MAKRKEKMEKLVDAMLDVERNFWDLLLDPVPEDAKKHYRAARKERLMALRSLLDARIKALEEGGKEGKRRAQRAEGQ